MSSMRRGRLPRLIVSLVLTVASTTAVLAVSAAPAHADASYPGNGSFYDWSSGTDHRSSSLYQDREAAKQPDWMKWVKDDTGLAEMSIPGTHDSMAAHGGDDPQTQGLCGSSGPGDITACDLTAQLEAGIRWFDIRVSCIHNVRTGYADELLVWHAGIYQYADLDDVLSTFQRFLTAHPDETVLALFAHERNVEETNEHCSDPFTPTWGSMHEKQFEEYWNKYPGLFWDGGGAYPSAGTRTTPTFLPFNSATITTDKPLSEAVHAVKVGNETYTGVTVSGTTITLKAGDRTENKDRTANGDYAAGTAVAPVGAASPTLGQTRGHVVPFTKFDRSKDWGLAWNDDVRAFDNYDSHVANTFELQQHWNEDRDGGMVPASDAIKKGGNTQFFQTGLNGSGGVFPNTVAFGDGVSQAGVNYRALAYLLDRNLYGTGIVGMDFPGAGLVSAIIAHDLRFADTSHLSDLSASFYDLVQRIAPSVGYDEDSPAGRRVCELVTCGDSANGATPGFFEHVMPSQDWHGMAMHQGDYAIDHDGLYGASSVDGFNIAVWNGDFSTAVPDEQVRQTVDTLALYAVPHSGSAYTRAHALQDGLKLFYPGTLWQVMAKQDDGSSSYDTGQDVSTYYAQYHKGAYYDVAYYVAGYASGHLSGTLTSSDTTSESGQSVTYTATFTPTDRCRNGGSCRGDPRGQVQFTDQGVTIPACQYATLTDDGDHTASSTCTVAWSASAGTHDIDARTVNGGYEQTYAEPQVVQKVTKAATTLALTSGSPSITGDAVTFGVRLLTAQGAVPPGTVSLTHGGADVDGCTALQPDSSGRVTCTRTLTTDDSPYALTARYAGDDDYATSSADLTQVVERVPTSTRVTSDTEPAVSRQQVTFTATVVAAPGHSAPTGTVGFTDDGPALPGCERVPLVDGSATCTGRLLATTPYEARPVVAVYSGDVGHAPSRAMVGQTVQRAPSTTTLGTSTGDLVTGQQVELRAEVLAGATSHAVPVTGTVAFSAGGTALPGCAARPLEADGTTTCLTTLSSSDGSSRSLTASSSGSDELPSSASGPVAVTVVRAPTSALLRSSGPSVTGEHVTYTASVAAHAPGGGTPTGRVDFVDGSDPVPGCSAVLLASGTATCQTVYDSPGRHSVTAAYAGSDDHAGSASSALAQEVTRAGTTTALVSSPRSSIWGQPVQLTATVTPVAPGAGVPGGAVTFSDGGVLLGTGTLDASGRATVRTDRLETGARHLTASYGGDAGFLASGTAAPYEVSRATTSSRLSVSSVGSVWGQPATLTGTITVVAPGAGRATGTVRFLDGATLLGTSDVGPDGTAQLVTATLPVGGRILSAVFSGDGHVEPSRSASVAHQVDPAATTTRLAASSARTVWGEVLTLGAEVLPQAPGAGTPAGRVVFYDGRNELGATDVDPALGVARISVATLEVGQHALTATYSGAPEFRGSTSTMVDHGVERAGAVLSLASSVTPALVGQEVALLAHVAPLAPGAGAPAGTVVFSDGGTTLGSAPVSPDTGQAVLRTSSLTLGAHDLAARYSGDSHFLAGGPASLTQQVTYAVALRYDPKTSHQHGATVPLSVQLQDASGRSLATATATVTADCVVPAGRAGCAGATRLDEAFRFVPRDGGEHQYLLRTKELAAGSYDLLFSVAGDPVQHRAPVLLR